VTEGTSPSPSLVTARTEPCAAELGRSRVGARPASLAPGVTSILVRDGKGEAASKTHLVIKTHGQGYVREVLVLAVEANPAALSSVGPRLGSG
jgi:hypothetical protein